jgi:hypothetical protein
MKFLTCLLFALLPLQLLFAQETNSPFNQLKKAYGTARSNSATATDKLKAEALENYSRTLDTLMDGLKKKGDLDTFLVVQTEQKRFKEEKTVPAVGTSPDILAGPAADYREKTDLVTLNDNLQTIKLLKQYIAALDGLIKKSMMQDKIAEAKDIKEEKDRAELVLADLASKIPEDATPAPSSKDNPTPDVKPAPSAAELKAAAKKEAREKAKPFQMHRYLVVEDTLSWTDAKAACTTIGGHLVTIGNKSENDFVCTLADGKSVWLGLSDESKSGKLAWVDGLSLRFSAWCAGEPSIRGGMSNYAALGRSFSDYGWMIPPPEALNGYICEWDY